MEPLLEEPSRQTLEKVAQDFHVTLVTVTHDLAKFAATLYCGLTYLLPTFLYHVEDSSCRYRAVKESSRSA